MGQFLQLINSTARLGRLGTGVFALIAVSTWPVWGAVAAPVAPAAATTATSASRPEDATRDTLNMFLERLDPKRLADLTAQNPAREQVLASIATFEQTRRPKEFSDNCLYYLTKFPPDPKDYADVLARLAISLEQNAGQGQTGEDAGLLTLLFDLADNFPAATEAVQRMRIFQADYQLHATGPEAALAVLHRLADAPETTTALRMLAAGRAAYIHEHIGQTDLAITAYRQAGADLSAGASANEALVRASLLLLELGRTDEAIEVINQLRGVPPEVLAQSSAQPVIKDLLDLAANPDQARAYWSHRLVWQTVWSNIAGRFGVMPPLAGATILAPYVDNYAQVQALAGDALRTGNAALYFQLTDEIFQSARWRPADLATAADMMYQGLALAPNQLDQIFALGEALEKDLPAADNELLRQLAGRRVDALMSHDRIPAARDAAQVALAQAGPEGGSGQALARAFGLAVLETSGTAKPGQMAAAARFLAATLADPAAHGNQRVLAIAELSDLYTSLGRDSDARTVLETELARPIDPSDPNAVNRAALQSALDRLHQRSLEAAGLDAGLAAWWKEHPLPWYDYVMAKPQAGPLSTVDEPAVQMARNFARALDHSASLFQRAGALEEAWNPYPEMFLRGSALVEAASAFITRPELPMEMRYVAWARAELHLFWTGQRAAAEKLLTLAPSGSPTASVDRADFDLWDSYLALPNTVEAQQAFAEKIFGLPVVRRTTALLVTHIANALASLNAVDAAQGVLDKLGQAKLDAETLLEYQAMADALKPMLATYRAVQPAAEALRQLVLDANPQAAAATMPAAWGDLNDTWTPILSLLTQDEIRQGLLVVIRDRVPYGRHPLQVFVDYASALTFNPADAALRMKLFETAQKLVTRDEDRFYAALFTSIVDFDDPEVARRGWADLAPGRAAEFTQTNGFIQYYDTLMKWRTGGTLDTGSVFGPLDSPALDPFKLRLLLDYSLQHGDRAGLQKLVDARREEDYGRMPALAGYLKALKLLAKQDALARATDAARLELAKDVAASWARPDIETAESVFDLARALGDPQAYPRDWVAALLGAIKNENSRDLLRLEDGRLQGDWAAVLDAANSYLARNPTNYDAYWFKAEALVHLGRRPEAAAPLRVYVKYSHNDDYYPEAVDLLKKIEAETPAAK